MSSKSISEPCQLGSARRADGRARAEARSAAVFLKT